MATITVGANGDLDWSPVSDTAQKWGSGAGQYLAAQYNRHHQGAFGLYHLDEGSGTVIADSGGNNYHGTLGYSNKWAAGWMGNSLHFNVATIGTIPLNNVPMDAFWADAWVKRNTSGPLGSRNWVVGCNGWWPGGDTRGWCVGWREFDFNTVWWQQLRLPGGGESNWVRTTSPMVWEHIAWWIDGSGSGYKRMWENGVMGYETAQGDLSGNLSPNGNPRLAHCGGEFGAVIDMHVSELRLHSSAPQTSNFTVSRWKYLSAGDCTEFATPTAVNAGIGSNAVQPLALGGAARLTALDWDATAASSDERLQSIEADTGTGYITLWTYGDPAPPVDISGLGLETADGALNLRVTQRHSTDTVHEFAHRLEALTLAWEPLAARYPAARRTHTARLGPRLIHIGR